MVVKIGVLITLVATTEAGEMIRSNLELQKVKVGGKLFCVEEVHPGNDNTSRSVVQDQVPRHISDFLVSLLERGLSVAFTEHEPEATC